MVLLTTRDKMNLMEKLVTILQVVVDFLFIEQKFLRFDFFHHKDILLGLIEE